MQTTAVRMVQHFPPRLPPGPCWVCWGCCYPPHRTSWRGWPPSWSFRGPSAGFPGSWWRRAGGCPPGPGPSSSCPPRTCWILTRYSRGHEVSYPNFRPCKCLGLLLAQTSDIKCKALQVSGLLLVQTSDVKCRALLVSGLLLDLTSDVKCKALQVSGLLLDLTSDVKC